MNKDVYNKILIFIELPELLTSVKNSFVHYYFVFRNPDTLFQCE